MNDSTRELRVTRSRKWTKYSVAERLRRDAQIATAFLGAHGLAVNPTRTGAELQAAEDYCRWSLADGPAHLDALDGAEVDAFVDEWRLRAVTADIRSLSMGAELRLMVALPLLGHGATRRRYAQRSGGNRCCGVVHRMCCNPAAVAEVHPHGRPNRTERSVAAHGGPAPLWRALATAGIPTSRHPANLSPANVTSHGYKEI
ncbi:hypothetical protein JPH1_52960 (plasmid) [Mycobacterium avium subsp. hominissuis]|uniref:Uncharacterized protein n=1 Tax=Mycobacterium avium subsp. hominissuis TaxID=439334 RepID=A0AAI8X5C3_MYCAV|nr:hypothetical protein JPH1_52960 [Mycobacterium avium subsp. hominissuis]